MTSFNEYLAQGNAWLLIPAAVLLGALHGLEPGHSKTMMAAFIVAIRGTVRHATRRFQRFNELARKMPYVSSSVMVLIGLWIAIHGLKNFPH